MNYAQKKDGWCGPASLSYALHEQGVEASQEDLAKETKTTVGEGVDPYPLKKAAEKHGMETLVLQGGEAKDIWNLMKWYKKEGWSIIVDFLDGEEKDDGHYAVVEEVGKDALSIFDPSGGKEREIPKDQFVTHWLDYKDGKVFRHYALLLQ